MAIFIMNNQKFKVFKTNEFDKQFERLSSEEKIQVNKILLQLYEKGDLVGKPLSGLSFFREKKFGGKRLYYLVYETYFVILAVALSNKKTQQATINQIIRDLSDYQRFVFETLKNKKLI
ncbi:MAG: hypothetical protein NUV57_02220 [archaeon]|nr:hypothetical protein [archaeon]